MPVKTILLTTKIENAIISRLYHREGKIPCYRCGKAITSGNRRKLVIRSNRSRCSKTSHYCIPCGKALKLL